MVISMMMILLITVMSISMAKTFFLEERMAGSLREKSRSFAAAQAALRYGEWYLTQNAGAGVACPTSGSLTATPICNNAMPPVNAPGTGARLFPAYFEATVPVALNVQFLATPTKDSFWNPPGIYINFLGPTTQPRGALYQIDAYGYGGTQLSVSEVQSTVWIACSNRGVKGYNSVC
ncbi:MAG: hypothetical protein P4L91_10765 [Burkholderiaceae bacterium]|nr:hypothetical protein [Burkholderiaceae bacterium]